MAQAVTMPKVGISVESCIITQWNKKPGDTVAAGDILFEYETDKSSLTCESPAAGTLLECFYNEWDEVPVLAAVCAIGQPGEDVSALRPRAGEPQKAARAPAPAEQQAAKGGEPADYREPADIASEPKISPRAKNLAEKHNLNPAFAAPTGPNGRVIERDVRKAIASGEGLATGAAVGGAAAGTAIGGRAGLSDAGVQSIEPPVGAAPAAEYEDVVFTGVRRAISKSMSASLANIPQLTHNFSFDASAILAYRAMLKERAKTEEMPNITLNDMILYVVSRVLPKYPAMNCNMLDAFTQRRFRDVQLGVAVDTEKGLMVPVIRNANRLSLAQIAQETKRLAKSAQEGSILPDEMGGGTFTVSNLGTLAVESFTPVINPPEAGILGVGTITQRARKGKDGDIELYPAITISLSYDHRAIDGAPASRFAMELCGGLENFALLLAR